MKNSPYISVLILICCFCSLANADEASDREALRGIKTVYEEAVRTRDVMKLLPYISDDTTAVMVTGDVIKGASGLQEYWGKIQGFLGKDGVYELKINTEKTDIFTDLAVSRGTANERVQLGSGEEMKYISTWTAVCHRENGGWKVLRMQATMDPINNPFITQKIHLGNMIYLGLGTLLGMLLIGMLIFFRSRGRGKASAQ